MKTLNTIALTLAFIVGGSCAATPPAPKVAAAAVVVAPTAEEIAAKAAAMLVAVQATKAAWGEAEVELQKQLDEKVACSVTPEGVTTAGQATVAAVAAATEVSPDLQVAAIMTVQTTHDAWVSVAAGIDYVRIPAWTQAVHVRASNGAAAATSAAIAQQIASEQRVQRLVNPSWADQLAWWWSR